jgi:epoxide hydrolase 4
VNVVDDLVTHRRITVGSLDMHVAEAGDGPLVVLLHGFPDFWYSWRRQIPALVDAGYRVLVPDLRGYADTDAPRGVTAYRIEHLVADVRGLISAAGQDRASLVGHDWGGIVAWAAAGAHPEGIERLAVCNGPHPKHFQGALFSSRQLLRSWYVFAFQLPWLPEFALRANNGRLLRRLLRSGAERASSFTDEDLDRYADALLGRRGLSGPIDYYRAAVREIRRPSEGFAADRAVPVHQRVLVLWGERDPALIPELAEPPTELVPDARVVRYRDAGHWVHLDEAEAVNAEVLRWLSGAPDHDAVRDGGGAI